MEDDDNTLGLQNWAKYFRQPPLRGNLGLQLMPNVGFLDSFLPTKSLFPPRILPEMSPMPIDYSRDIWIPNPNNESHVHHQHSNNYGSLQMLQPPADPPNHERVVVLDDPGVDIMPLKKRSEKSVGRRRSVIKNLEMVINGIDLDLSGIPAPLCTCTGHPQQCYRWGAGGWQSACCTTSMSLYPLPMSTKRRGSRIAGRKMSQGAFKKVLEKLAGEGQDFSNPIDLKLFWAKHGTNKFVTIR